MASLRQCGSCLRHPPPVDRTIAALNYAFPWDRLLQRFKFNDGIELQTVLLERLEQALQLEQAEAPDWLLCRGGRVQETAHTKKSFKKLCCM